MRKFLNSLINCAISIAFALGLVSLIASNASANSNKQALQALFTVTNTADSGPGSLRQAFLDANGDPGADTIAFAIGAPGSQQTIQPLSALPAISDPLTIDGWSQGGAGYTGPPLVEINGDQIASWNTTSGLQITGGGSTVRGLAVNYFNIGISLETAGNNIIEGNIIGLALDRDTPIGNRTGMRIVAASDNNRIGTNGDGVNDTAERNIISASGFVEQNNSTGILIEQGSDNNWIAGNYIGTDATGTQDRGNAVNGITTGGVTIIGTDGDGAGDDLEGNLISGNNGFGIGLSSASNGSRVSGNKIGTDASGTTAIPNNSNGVSVGSCSPGQCSDYIIGTNGDGVSDALEGNLISGNGSDGVFIPGGSIGNSVVAGNKIGTDITGAAAIPNGDYGVHLGGDSSRLGTNNDGISDNLEGNLISGNGDGSGNDDTGVYIPSGADNHTVAGNRIGVGADGASPLGNLLHGIYIDFSTTGNMIGGAGQSQANRIGYNGGDGISTSGATTVVGNRLQGNQVFENAGLGIDLANNGVTLNDLGDGDTGPNGLQNYPVLSAAAAFGANVVITGTLNSTISTTFTLDFYSSEACDSSGNGEGELYLGAGQVTTDANGDASFSIAVAGLAGNGDSVTATASDPAGNTSELSACVVVLGEEPISGLQASNDSPTSLGFPTHFTATLATGTGVSFSWDFGDGSDGAGAFPTHVYLASGSYTATVTASNSLGSAMDSTDVTITAAPACAATPDEGVTVFGSIDHSAVQQAVDIAAEGSTIKIAGTCAGVVEQGGSSQTVFIDKPLTLAGGYAVTDWSTPDPDNHPTTLDALSLGRVAFITDTVAVALENLILVNGAAPGSGTGGCPGYGCGGGIYTNGSLDLHNIVFQDNSARRGGGAYVAGELSAVDVDWLDNTATNQRGGGLEVYGDAMVTGGMVQGNTATYAGGIFANAGVVISGTQFISNTASSTASGSGGAVYAAGPLSISNALFEGNQSYTGAGAVLHSPGTSESLFVANTQFINNSALNASAQGGALYAGAGTSTIESSHFEGNSAPGSSGAGGALVAFKGLTLTDTVLISNTAGGQGGAIYHWGLSDPADTSLVYPLVIDNSRLAANQAGAGGGGLYFRQGFAASNVPVQVSGSTFDGNAASLDGGGAYLGQPGAINTSVFQNNLSATAAGGGLYTLDQLELFQSTIMHNVAIRAGGVYVLGALTAVDTDWLDNTATNHRGGGLEVYGEAELVGGLLQGNTGWYGGGIFADAGLVISGTQFISNTASSATVGSGGAVYAAGPLSISNALFEGNQSYTGAGAVLHSPGTGETLLISDSQFNNNTSLNTTAQGGALYTNAESSVIQSSHFEGNSAPGSSGVGGAIVALKDLTLTDTVLVSNTAGGQGGAIYHWGLSEAGQTDLITTLTLTGTRLVSNTAGGQGGGLYFRQGFAASNVPVQVSGSTFDGNTASLHGGGAYLGQPAAIASSLFLGNASLNASGGGLALDGGSETAYSTVTNAVFAGNTASSSAGIYAGGSGQVNVLHTTLADSTLSPVEAVGVNGPSLFLVNTIVVSHTVGIELIAGVVSADRTLFYGNLADTQGAVDNEAPVMGAPNFLDAPGGDYHLALGSAAIDAASEAGIPEDLDGDIRPIIGYSDIGADEFGDSTLVDPAASTTISATVSPVQAIIIRIPPGAIIDPRIFRLLPVKDPSVPPASPRRPAGMFFIFQPDPPAAAALQQALFETPFLLPVEITLQYAEADLAGVAEDSLFLAVLDESSGEWVDATTTCPSPGTVLRQPAENRITVTSCAAGEFALLGSALGGALYLPLIQR